MDLLDRLASSVPELERAWAAWAKTSPDADLRYVGAGALAELIYNLSSSDEAMARLFSALERELENGSPSDRELLIVGLLEAMQHRVLRSKGEKRLMQAMGPEALRAWSGLQDAWAARLVPDDFNRLVAYPLRSRDAGDDGV